MPKHMVVEKQDIVVIGAGPAGIACGIAAVKRKFTVRLVDQGTVADAIVRFPAGMTFFSTADQLELAGIPFTSPGLRPTRQEVIKYYHALVRMFDLPVHTHTAAEKVVKKAEGFEICCRRRERDVRVAARYVILATGFFDHPNRLAVPGEELPLVRHDYAEPWTYFRQKVVIIGGGNSAVEAALELFRNGAQVTLVHRGEDVRGSVKYWLRPDLQNRIREKNITAYFESTVERISEDGIQINRQGTRITIPADAVLVLIGFHPGEAAFRMCGVDYDPSTLEPACRHETLESNVADLYLAGSVIAGRNTNKIFIENGREHGEIILSHIQKKILK